MRPLIDPHGYHLFRPSAWILAEGEDAHDFLQSQFSNDISNLEIGSCIYGLWLDLKGKVQGDSFILRNAEESFLLMSYRTPESVIMEKLGAFIVADDVEFTGLAEEVEGIALIGDVADSAAEIGFEREGSCLLEFEGGVVYIIPGYRGARSIDLLCSAELRATVLEKLKLNQPEITHLDNVTMETLRISNLIPSIPLDIGPDELPQEGGLENDAISFTKGCYLGQEVMSRLHSMGKVRRSLRLAHSAEAVEYGSALYADSRKVGVLKTSVSIEDGHLALVLISNVVSESATLLAGDPEGGTKLILVP